MFGWVREWNKECFMVGVSNMEGKGRESLLQAPTPQALPYGSAAMGAADMLSHLAVNCPHYYSLLTCLGSLMVGDFSTGGWLLFVA